MPDPGRPVYHRRRPQPVRQTVIERDPPAISFSTTSRRDSVSRCTEYLSDPLPVPIDAPEPFLAVAGSWQSDTDTPGPGGF
jgi:hypothetical protein